MENFVGREINSNDFGSVAGMLGTNGNLSAGTYDNGGRVYKVTDTGRGTRTISDVTSSELAIRAQGKRMDAIAPAVQSLQAGIPELQGVYQGAIQRVDAQRAPLTERYQVLLDEITAKGAKQASEASKITSQEYGKRGIPLTSTMAQQDIFKAVSGVENSTTLEKRGVVSDREANLLELTNLAADLADKGVLATRDVRNMIANLQAGAGNAAIDDTLNQMKLLADIEANKASIAAQKYAVDKQTAASGIELTEVNGRKVSYNKITGEMKDLGPVTTTGSGTGALSVADLLALQGKTGSTVANQMKASGNQNFASSTYGYVNVPAPTTTRSTTPAPSNYTPAKQNFSSVNQNYSPASYYSAAR